MTASSTALSTSATAATPRASRPGRCETGPQHRTHPTPTRPKPTRTIPAKPQKPTNSSGATERATERAAERVTECVTERNTEHVTGSQDAPAQGTVRKSQGRAADPSRTAAIVVTAASEVLSGLRPVDHLARWTSPSLFDALARRAGLASRILGHQAQPRRPRIRSVRAEMTVSGACEATVLLDEGNRVRAAAARLEMLRERWVLTGLEIA